MSYIAKVSALYLVVLFFGHISLWPRRKLLGTVVAPVCNVDATVGCHRDASRPVELPVASALCAPLADEHAIGGELLDAVVPHVYNVDATVGCHSYAPRVVELPVARTLSPHLLTNTPAEVIFGYGGSPCL